MSSDPVHLPSLEQAKLRAERVRIFSMLVLFTAFALLGVFRAVFPVQTDEQFHPAVILLLGISIGYAVYEAQMLRRVNRALAEEQAPTRWLGVVHAGLECIYPAGVVLVLMLLYPELRFTLLVSPVYVLMLLLITISVLRLDVMATLLIGSAITSGYAALVAVAFFGFESPVANPHPTAMYVNLAVMLALTTLVAMFMTLQVREYVLAAVREVEVRRQRDRLVRDLEIASEIQKGLLPRSTPRLQGYEIAASSLPAEQTGGDYYDWQELNPLRLAISLADVTGHGIGPALVTAACRAYVRATMSREQAPRVVLDCVERLLRDDIPPGRFVTFALLDVNTETHEMLLLSAGHGPTFHLRADEGELAELGSQGLPFGVLDDQVLDEPVLIRPAVGDVVVLASDGFLEQHNSSGEAFGKERLRSVLLEHRCAPAAAILSAMEQAVRDFSGGVLQEDDRTAVVIKRAQK